jgi:hypothetical protein
MKHYIEYFNEQGKLLLRTKLPEGTGHDWRVENAIKGGLPKFSHYRIRGNNQACMKMEMEYAANGHAIWREVDDNNVLKPYDGRFDSFPPIHF